MIYFDVNFLICIHIHIVWYNMVIQGKKHDGSNKWLLVYWLLTYALVDGSLTKWNWKFQILGRLKTKLSIKKVYYIVMSDNGLIKFVYNGYQQK